MSVDLSSQKEQEEQARKMLLELIAASPRLHKTPEDEQTVRKAFELANDAHRGMYRKSGELYIFHPVAVARIAAMEIGLATTGVVSALLHDVVEDTDLTVEDIKNLFGEKVALIVDGLTKLEKSELTQDFIFDQTTSQQVETFRKLMMSMIEDVRVILIKLSDRLHNMRTLESMPEHKRYRIAAETLYVYAPIAHRLGLFPIKTELEDLSLKYEHPQVYTLLKEKLKSNESDYNRVIQSISDPICKRLDEQGFKYTISSRPKSIYSIWHKMQTKNIPFEEIYDILAMRIVFEPNTRASEKAQCWVIYSIITDLFSPKPDRLRDWISTPKANGYEALHTTVMSPFGRWVEIQIRSQRMDEIAEKGLAAHWKYKEDDKENVESVDIENWISEIRKMLESSDNLSMEFLDAFKLNLFASEIIIFTPKGDMRKMPVGSTVLDFAYEIHSKKFGNHCIGAKVNYKLVPLSHELKSGDQVEIICSEKQTPKYEWLDFVTTAKAKAEIRSVFKEERRELCEKGKQLLEEELQKRKISLTIRVINKMLHFHHVSAREDLFFQIGKGVITFENIEKVLTQKSASKWVKIWKLTFGKKKEEDEDEEAPEDDEVQLPKKKNIVLSDDEKHEYQVAPCCNPIPGDDVVAYMDEENKIVLHSRRCPNAMKLMSSRGDRILSAEWQSHKVLSYLVVVEISGTDRQGLVSDITGIITRELNVNMRSVHFEAHDGVFIGSVYLYIHNADDLKNLIGKISKVKGVHNVTRKDQNEQY